MEPAWYYCFEAGVVQVQKIHDPRSPRNLDYAKIEKPQAVQLKEDED
jgi:hypothetical protein